MEEVVPAVTRWAVRTDLPLTPTLAPQVVEAAVLRLRWISLSCAVLTGLLVYLDGLLQPETAGLLKRTVLPLVWLLVVLISLGIIALPRFRLLSPLAILNLGLGFEVVVAAAISFSETALPR